MALESVTRSFFFSHMINIFHCCCVEHNFCFLQLTKKKKQCKARKSIHKCRNEMWPTVKAVLFEETAGSECFFSFCSLQLCNLPLAPGWSITFKVSCFPSLGITAPDTPVARVRYRRATGGTPPGATMSCPWPDLGQTSVDACNPALLLRLFGLTEDPPWRHIDVVG